MSGRRASDRTKMENQLFKGAGTLDECPSVAKRDQGGQVVHTHTGKVVEHSKLSREGENRVVVEGGREQVGLEPRKQGELSKEKEVLIMENGAESQQLIQGGQNGSEEMQVEVEATTICTAERKGQVTVAGSPISIQEVEHYRVPLLDYTNMMDHVAGVGSREGKINLKGQSKRRARMQAAGKAEKMCNNLSMPDDEIRKRSIDNMAENFAVMDSIPARKKNKCDGKMGGDQNSEVVDTSWDWSQAYK